MKVTFDTLEWEQPSAMKFYSEVDKTGVVAVWYISGETTYRARNGWDFAYRISPEGTTCYQLFDSKQLAVHSHQDGAPDCNNAAIWEARDRFQKIVSTEKDGLGYSGGHMTAARMGWNSTPPRPESYAIMFTNASRQGAFTGYWPKMRSYVLFGLCPERK